MQPEQTHPRPRGFRRRLLGDIFHGVKRYLILGVAATLCATFLTYVTPLVVSFTVDSVIGDKTPELPAALSALFQRMGGRAYFSSHIWVLASLVVLVTLLGGVFTYLRGHCIAFAGEGLAKRLRRAGSDHRKYIRQVFVSVDITAPMYWWKEYDTYKVATVANSTSTMHKIHSKPFELDDFSHDHLTPESEAYMQTIVDQLEKIRLKYVETKDKAYWYDMIQLLPSSYNQMRTCTMNYETLINIYYARKAHKLEEWHSFCRWIESLPYAKELIVAAEE